MIFRYNRKSRLDFQTNAIDLKHEEQLQNADQILRRELAGHCLDFWTRRDRSQDKKPSRQPSRNSCASFALLVLFFPFPFNRSL